MISRRYFLAGVGATLVTPRFVMGALATAAERDSPDFAANAARMEALVADLRAEAARVAEGGNGHLCGDR